jgi:hypothetical protein
MHVFGKNPQRLAISAVPPTRWTTRQISRLLIALLVLPLGGTATAFSQTAAPLPPPASAAGKDRTPTPGAEIASASLLPLDVSGETTPDAPQPQNTPASPPAQTNPPQQQPAPQQPMGTAAAPYEQPGGITASRPAGAAIAPAKQRRTRTLFIRVGVLIAAAAAVGTVMALSSASPSTPH